MSTHFADRYNQAQLFAARVYRSQILSDSPLSCLVYLGMVVNKLLAVDRDGAVERLGEALQIVVLYDTLEDAATSPEELRQQFGEFVCADVQTLGKRVGDDPKRSLDGYLQVFAEGSAQYALVKLCGRITNPQPLPQTWNQDKIVNYHQESQLTLARLDHAHAVTARRLREKVEHYCQYHWSVRRQSESTRRGAVIVASKEPTTSQSERRFSFKFFPARTEAGHEKPSVIIRNLAGYKPDFFSCICGVGGSIRDRTLNIVLQLDGEVKVPIAPHLSCVGNPKTELHELLGRYHEAGICRIVAPRGDLPLNIGVTSGELRYTNEPVDSIRTETGSHFHIGVVAYPEVHPQTRNFEDNLANFAHRVKAGASSAITQYLFSADAYFYFVERVTKLNVDIPMVPGTMSITNYSKLMCFPDTRGAELPRRVRKQLKAYGGDSRNTQAFGERVISETCEHLLGNDAPGLHFYTLNQTDPSLATRKNLRLPR